jgi:hypothetical protein
MTTTLDFQGVGILRRDADGFIDIRGVRRAGHRAKKQRAQEDGHWVHPSAALAAAQRVSPSFHAWMVDWLMARRTVTCRDLHDVVLREIRRSWPQAVVRATGSAILVLNPTPTAYGLCLEFRVPDTQEKGAAEIPNELVDLWEAEQLRRLGWTVLITQDIFEAVRYVDTHLYWATQDVSHRSSL